jgi:hypothetical protein
MDRHVSGVVLREKPAMWIPNTCCPPTRRRTKMRNLSIRLELATNGRLAV